MGATRMTWRALAVAAAMAGLISASCTNGSSDTSASTTASNTTTAIPDEQKPPLLRDSWTPEDLEQLAKIEVPGYQDGEIGLTDSELTRVFVPAPDPAGVTLTAKVLLAPCDPFSCWDLAEEPDQEHMAELRSLLGLVGDDNPDLVFEYKTDELIGDFEAFTLYWRSFAPDEDAYVIGYHALYHDDLNRIEITVTPNGAPTPADDDMLEAQMPMDWAREVTADVLAAFVDELNADR